MASQDDIKSFIEQQREAGAFDSTGQFSVDLRKAHEKSRLATQDASGAHALLWVQAATYFNPLYLRINYGSIRMKGMSNSPGRDSAEPHWANPGWIPK